MRPGALLSATTRKVPAAPGAAAPDADTVTTPAASGVPALNEGSESGSNEVSHVRPGTLAGSSVHTWQTAPRSIRTDSACGPSIGSSGQRRMGRVAPTWTGTDRIARRGWLPPPAAVT